MNRFLNTDLESSMASFEANSSTRPAQKEAQDSESQTQSLTSSVTKPHTFKPYSTASGCSISSESFRTFAGVAGNIMEWYDFSLFANFSDIIGKVFFPPQDGTTQLIESFAVFGSAFFVRPLGGLLLGMIGDKFGRKKALEISIFLMAFPTFLLGCLPTYSQVGPLSFVLLIMVRLIQGLSVGGQLMTSLAYTVEGKPHSKWGLYGGYVFGATNIGTFIGSLVSAIMREVMTAEQLVGWGWRIPFLSGILVSGVAVYFRYSTEEDTWYDRSENPLGQALRKDNRRALCSAMMVPCLNAAGFHVTFVWMPIFMSNMVEPPVPHAFWVSTAALFVDIFNYPICGYLSDRVGRLRMMTFGAITVGIGAPLMTTLVSLGDSVVALSALLSLGFSIACYSSPTMAWLVETFPPEVRVTSTAIGYSIAQGIMGGISPALSTFMVSRAGPVSPGCLISAMAILGLIGLWGVAPEAYVKRSGGCLSA